MCDELLRWFAADGLSADASWEERRESVERLRAAIQANTWAGRKTPYHQGRAVLKRLERLAEA